MTWTIATAKKRLGIASANTDQDADITAAMDAAVAISQSYCGRLILEQTDRTDIFYRNSTWTIQLPLYPVTEISALLFDSNIQDVSVFSVRADMGQILLPDQTIANTVSVTYSGGYDPLLLPADLELAMWGVFDVTWAANSAGAATGGIASIQVPDVGTIRFSGDTSGSTYGAYDGMFAPYMLPRC